MVFMIDPSIVRDVVRVHQRAANAATSSRPARARRSAPAREAKMSLRASAFVTLELLGRHVLKRSDDRSRFCFKSIGWMCTRRDRVRNRLVGILVFLSFLLVAAFAQDKKTEAEPLKIKVGDVAPDFTLLEYDGHGVKPVSLHDFKGKKDVALAFFVFAFTGG
jgi:hypothetical protein